MDAAAPYRESFAALLGQEPAAIAPCAHGGNNRVFRVSAGGRDYLAKCYFTGTGDTRNRLESEWLFLEYAEAAGVPNVPRPIARDTQAHIAFYSFLEGRTPMQVNAAMVQAAAQLICNLNRRQYRELAAHLPNASESCFSADAYIALTAQRLEQLESGEALPQHQAGFHALLKQMQEAFAHCRDALCHGYGEALSHEERCLSPSDFGFHNSLLSPAGQLQFIDFEYAGWDDPTKMLCDFFLHPGIPVDHAWAPLFWQEIGQSDLPLSTVASRAALLYPVLGLRWCCIILNVFIPQWAARRAFADKDWNIGMAQAEQLAKAEHMLGLLQRNPFGAL
ncbi:MAG: aminoglycoside phosphotransferase family protein [Pseudomonadota bacterium]|nr:aminoglycoside phosphotransferase family protein [Pseudomonadota bacterium]